MDAKWRLRAVKSTGALSETTVRFCQQLGYSNGRNGGQYWTTRGWYSNSSFTKYGWQELENTVLYNHKVSVSRCFCTPRNEGQRKTWLMEMRTNWHVVFRVFSKQMTNSVEAGLEAVIILKIITVDKRGQSRSKANIKKCSTQHSSNCQNWSLEWLGCHGN